MKNTIEDQIEFLLSAALRKCGNIHDAEDLTQETLMCALAYIKKGNVIQDIHAWLLAVLNNKWNDFLRKKYQQPIIGIGEGFEIIDETDDISHFHETDDGEHIRKSIAFISKIYREVIVRYYMNGESISDISSSLEIPEGTVKRRLHSGREKIKKGFENMEKYSKESYQPISLRVYNSGNGGKNGEPGSLVNGDLLVQNVLWAIYHKPKSIEEISNSLGVPTAYIEPVVEKLVNGELVKPLGNRFHTDFIITTNEDNFKYIWEQKRFVKEHFGTFYFSQQMIFRNQTIYIYYCYISSSVFFPHSSSPPSHYTKKTHRSQR